MFWYFHGSHYRKSSPETKESTYISLIEFLPQNIEIYPFNSLSRYRGLKSFRTSPWDPKENLPLDYARYNVLHLPLEYTMQMSFPFLLFFFMAQGITDLFRIFQFQNFNRTKKKILKKEDDDSEDKAQVGKIHSSWLFCLSLDRWVCFFFSRHRYPSLRMYRLSFSMKLLVLCKIYLKVLHKKGQIWTIYWTSKWNLSYILNSN